MQNSVLSRKFRTLLPIVYYMFAYLALFWLIEHWNRLHYTVIHTPLDDYIPFVPAFVVPYVLWFPYVVGAGLFLLFAHEESYHRLCTGLAIGMSVFIAVSVVFPNIHLMRPEAMPGQDAFTRLVQVIYLADTPTNLTPSIHVFNSLVVMAAFWKWDWRRDDGRAYTAAARGAGRFCITALGLMISLSTMFIKQHSFADVVSALGLFAFTYIIVYRFDFLFIGGRHLPAFRPARIRTQ